MASNPKTAGESSKFMWVKQCHIPSPSHHHSSRWYDAPIPSHESLPGLDGNNLVASPEKNNPSDGLIVVLWCLAGRDICWWVALFRSRKMWVGIRSLHWDIQTQARLFKQRCFLYIMGGSLSGAGQSSAGRWGCGWIKSAGWFPTKNSPHFGKLSTFWIVLDGLLVYFTMDG